MKKAAVLLAAVVAWAWAVLPAGGQASEPDRPSEPEAVEASRRAEALGFTLFPILKYTTETGWAAGGGGWRVERNPDDNRPGKPDSLWVSLVYTQRDQVLLWIIPEVYFRMGASRLRLNLQFRKYPTRFYGIGNDTPEEGVEHYTPLSALGQITFTQPLAGQWSYGPYLHYDQTRIAETEAGGALDTGAVPGAEGSTVIGAGFVVLRDTRNHHFQPARGSFLEVTWAWYGQETASDFAFSRTVADGRWYFSPGSGQVVALRGLVQSIAGEAPFNVLSQIGGRFLFRGLFEGRYRDNAALVLQAEYRVRLNRRWGLAGFLATGDVAPALDELATGAFKTAGGGGLRYAYNPRERINVRLDLAASGESTGVYLSVGEAF